MNIISKFRAGFKLISFMLNRKYGRLEVPDLPHMDEASTREFLALLRSAELYLEFGSGGSTVEAARLGIRTITIENDASFARAVLRRISPAPRVEINAVGIGLSGPWGIPVFKRPNARRLQRWRGYVDTAVERINAAGTFPDLVLVDGRFRKACILVLAREAARAKAVTILFVDDYAERQEYHSVEAVLAKPRMVGRAAIFSPGEEAGGISDSLIKEAVADYR